MDRQQNTTTYTLPDGRVVNVSSDPESWPKQVGESGYVPIEAIIPDPEQPRNTKEITTTKSHHSFAQSMRKHGQGLIVEVTLLNESERLQNPGAWYQIVDGERRYLAIGKKGAGIPLIHITVAPTKGKRERHLRQVVLNTLQEPLPTPDLVRALIRIRDDYGCTSASQVADLVGMQQVTVNDLLHMDKLAPELLELTDKVKHPKKTHLATKPAVALAKIEADTRYTAHERQVQAFNASRTEKIHGAVAQTSFFEKYHSEEVRARSHRPAHKRDRLASLFNGVINSDLVKMDKATLVPILERVSTEDIEMLRRKAEQARECLLGLQTCIEQYLSDRQNSTIRIQAPLVREMPKTSVQIKEKVVSSAPKNKILVSTVHQVSSVERHAPPIQPKAVSVATTKVDHPSWIKHGSLYVECAFYDENVTRMVMGVVDRLDKYERLWNGRHFKWQREGAEKPPEFPTLEEVRAAISALQR